MTQQTPTPTAVLVIVPDPNVLIHGKALADLPWEEFGRPEIEILFVPPAIRELDKLKTQAGRPNKIARALSSDIRALIGKEGRSANVRGSSPKVTKRVELKAVTRAMEQGLDLAHADQSLINYCLSLKAEGLDVVLLTDDTICGTTASEFGLPVKFLPDDWLRAPEQDETSKENAKLKDQLKRLSAAGPQVELGFVDAEGKPLDRLEASLTRWRPLDEREIVELLEEVQQVCPRAESFTPLKPTASDQLLASVEKLTRAAQLASFQPRSVFQPATEEEIEQYKCVQYPEWLAGVRECFERLHEDLIRRIEWPTVVAIAANLGARPATDVLLRMRAQGRFLLKDIPDAEKEEEDTPEPQELALPLPPEPPRGKTKVIDPRGLYKAMGTLGSIVPGSHVFDISRLASPKPRRKDAFYWRSGKGSFCEVLELECTNWRHGQEDSMHFRLAVQPEELQTTSGAIELGVHASNISDPPAARIPVRLEVVEQSPVDLARELIGRLGRLARSAKRA